MVFRGYRLLCTGDLHVGRRPSRIEGALDPLRCSCAAMFGLVVERAIAERVDAVAISGDLVDQSNKFHEAIGPLERGLRLLAEAGIDVVAVAGNHDFDVLPRLAASMEHNGGSGRFHLLGQGGVWQCATVGRGDGASPPLRVVGFSFPTEKVLRNPLAALRVAELDGFSTCGDGPVIGLLHADLDQPASTYGPVMRRDLCTAPGTCACFWLLGHIHRPSWMPSEGGSPALLYPGSPAAMDPGESGVHGPWLVEIDPTGNVAARQIPLSPVRYDSIEIDLSTAATPQAFDALLQKHIRACATAVCDAAAQAGGGAMAPQLMCLRLRLTGATPLHRHLQRLAAEAIAQVGFECGGCRVRLDAVTIDTRPPVNLQQLAAGRSVAAELARLLIELSATPAPPSLAPLVSQAAAMVQEIGLSRAYQPLSSDRRPNLREPAADAAAIRAILHRQGMLLLDQLLAQRSGQSEDPCPDAGEAAS